ELDTALAKVNSNSIISSDMLLGKKVSQWIVFAKAMKLKLYMRSSFAEDNSAKIMTLVNDPELVMTSDIKMAIYSDAAEKRNPWYECNWSGSGLGTYNNIATYPIISYLKSTNDPRMSALYKKAANKGEYLGLIPGSKTKMPSGTKTNDYSFPIMTATTPVYFYTVSELNFFKAEAEARWGTNAAAKADYEAAIDANFNLHGTSGASAFVATDAISWDKATNLEQKLKLIGLQKWVALCMVNHFEGWTEIRRLHYPAFSASAASDIYSDESLYTPGDLIVPWVNNLGGTKVVKRVPFPETAVNYNKNTPAQVAVSTPVWWDVR
ncbi:MAG: SusD/RagB family nutrient-binding outer membrane lipoprotein, partial [Bacteroidota bacterium]|nr:SusD/RagB family nutrient-binding outer membrane lipoprotein [Bacteroidota bacterium]